MKQLQGMLAFVEAATSGSLTAAAARLEVTPAAISKSLARLESQLGVRLLNRSTQRRPKATPTDTRTRPAGASADCVTSATASSSARSAARALPRKRSPSAVSKSLARPRR